MMQRSTWILLTVGLLLPLPPTVDAEERQAGHAVKTQVGQWQLQELSFPNIAILKNPFSVKLNGTFTHASSGKRLPVKGFYRGNDTFAIRFMSWRLGKWAWATESSVPKLSGISGSHTVVPSTEPGPIRPDPQHPTSWLHADGVTRYYWNHGYNIFLAAADETHSTLGGWRDYLDYFKNHRMNGVLMLIQPGAGQRTRSTCREGAPPVGVLAGQRLPTFALVDRGIIDYHAQPWARHQPMSGKIGPF